MTSSEKFNNSKFGCFINSAKGRVFRLFGGIIFLILGIIFFDSTLGKISLIWSFFPLSATIFNICWISFALGGPLSGKKISEIQVNTKEN